jgi:peptidoglycan/LPS O-acetylase OafA/YrhL
MSEKPFDLRRLPVWLQYLISLSALAVVVTAAWLIGKDQPVPSWLITKMIPTLGWIYIVLLVVAMVSRWAGKKPE